MTAIETPDGSVGLTDEDLGLRILGALRTPVYQHARDGIIRYEITEGERANSAILELRDALDHLVLVAQGRAPGGPVAGLLTAEEHLRRAAVEPAQDMVESRIDRIQHCLVRYSLKRFIWAGLPSSRIVEERLQEIKRQLELGRTRKADVTTFEAAMENFASAHTLSVQLYTDLQPTTHNWFVRCGLYLLPLVTGITGVILGAMAL